MLSKQFFAKLNHISEEVGMNPRDLLLVMYMESGVSGSAHNPEGATGLIQFTDSTLKGLGLDKDQVKNFGQVSPERQLDFVKKYIQGKGGRKFTSATQYYHANYFPLTLTRWHGDNPSLNKNVIVTSKYAKDPRERMAYTHNMILDTNQDGYITVGDLTEILRRRASEGGFQKILSQFNTVAGSGLVSEQNLFDKMKGTSSRGNTMDNAISKEPNMNNTTKKNHNPFETNNNSLMSSVEKFLSNILASSNDKIIIYGNDLPIKIEFASILKLALKEELDINSEICSDKDLVELDLNKIEDEKAAKAVIQLCDAVAETFEYATNIKVFSNTFNNIKVNARYIPDIKSNFNPLDVKIADINYRKFRLRFIKGT